MNYQLGEPAIRSACSPRTVSASSAFLIPFLPLLTGIRHLAHVLSVPPTKAWLLCATPAGMDLYRQAMPVGTYRMLSPGFPKIVYFTSWRLRCSVEMSPAITISIISGQYASIHGAQCICSVEVNSLVSRTSWQRVFDTLLQSDLDVCVFQSWHRVVNIFLPGYTALQIRQRRRRLKRRKGKKEEGHNY